MENRCRPVGENHSSGYVRCARCLPTIISYETFTWFMARIAVDDDVKELILREKHDYRVCTACRGPALVPTTIKLPKDTDIVIKVGDYKLYVSAVQAEYINRVSLDMLYDENDIFSCPALSSLRSSGYLDRDQE